MDPGTVNPAHAQALNNSIKKNWVVDRYVSTSLDRSLLHATHHSSNKPWVDLFALDEACQLHV